MREIMKIHKKSIFQNIKILYHNFCEGPPQEVAQLNWAGSDKNCRRSSHLKFSLPYAPIMGKTGKDEFYLVYIYPRGPKINLFLLYNELFPR